MIKVVGNICGSYKLVNFTQCACMHMRAHTHTHTPPPPLLVYLECKISLTEYAVTNNTTVYECF